MMRQFISYVPDVFPKGSVSLTDGLGSVIEARITSATPKRNKLTAVVESVEVFKKNRIQRVLASAIPKGDRQSIMLDMATQLGMSTFIPLRCEYSATTYQPRMKERWGRIVRESCKQCRQQNFPEIEGEVDLLDLIEDESEDRLLLYADHRGSVVGGLQSMNFAQVRKIIMVIGPEGGFSDWEITALEKSEALSLRLSDRILRTEAAAVSLLSAMNQIIS